MIELYMRKYKTHVEFLQRTTECLNGLHVEVISWLIKDEEIWTVHKHITTKMIMFHDSLSRMRESLCLKSVYRVEAV